MKERILYVIWIFWYILCVALGTITERTVGTHIVLSVMALLFFVPAILLLVDALTGNNRKMLFRIRIVSLSSLVLTLTMIILNIVTVTASEKVGQVLDDLLRLFSAPMHCAYWKILSIFLWACVFVSSFPRTWKK